MSQLDGFLLKRPLDSSTNKYLPNWQGKTEINSVETKITIVNSDSETYVNLKNTTGINNWEFNEQYCDGLLLRLDYVNMPSNFLAPKVGKIEKTKFDYSLPWAMLRFNDGVFWTINSYPRQPKDFPLRREGAIDLNKSQIHQFNSVEDVLSVLRTLKDALGKATPIPIELPIIANRV